jgi:choline dehydrogenase-like flavoprotein
MDTEELRYATLEAVLDRLIPEDQDPGALLAGAGTYVGKRLMSDLSSMVPRFDAAADAIDAEARGAYGKAFIELEPSECDDLLGRLFAGRPETAWPEPPERFLSFYLRLVAEGFYGDPEQGGNRRAASWTMIGYPESDIPRHPLEFERLEVAPSDDYDVVVVGAGAAGGIVAAVLAEAGKRVLLLDRGKDLEDVDYRRDHLRNHRLSLYGHNTGPSLSGHPRVCVDAEGRARVVGPIEDGYNNNAMAVGGGSLVYGAMAFRFAETDFRMASHYGVPAHSSLADWPITYGDLEPYYDRAEWEVGVSGTAGLDARGTPRRRGYPMPPIEGYAGRKVLERGAAKLGWTTFPVPLLINSVPYLGRPACDRNNACVGFPCPSNAKGGSHNTLLVRGLRTGLLTLVAHAQALCIETDAQGKVVGVSYVIDDPSGPKHATKAARAVVVSAGAIESARLLLNSKSTLEPQGLGNAHDQVGRNLQGHVYQGAVGLMPGSVEDGKGPGISVVTSRFYHDNPGVVGGGVMHDELIDMPIFSWKNLLPPDVPRWGIANKQFMRDAYKRLLHVSGPVQETPSPDARVTVDPVVVDKWKMPVARLSGTIHPESAKAAEFLRQRMVEWLHASGAQRVHSRPIENPRFLSAGQHQAGTCRMGKSPRASVTDAWGRVHGHDNLYVVDASLHVTNGGVNPVLTVMALAFRCAEHIARAV